MPGGCAAVVCLIALARTDTHTPTPPRLTPRRPQEVTARADRAELVKMVRACGCVRAVRVSLSVRVARPLLPLLDIAAAEYIAYMSQQKAA